MGNFVATDGDFLVAKDMDRHRADDVPHGERQTSTGWGKRAVRRVSRMARVSVRGQMRTLSTR